MNEKYIPNPWMVGIMQRHEPPPSGEKEPASDICPKCNSDNFIYSVPEKHNALGGKLLHCTKCGRVKKGTDEWRDDIVLFYSTPHYIDVATAKSEGRVVEVKFPPGYIGFSSGYIG